MLSDALVTLLYLAVAVEFITESLRESIPCFRKLPAQGFSAALGILICFLTGQGLLAPAGGGFIRCAALDYLLTGLLISRGAGVMHDLIGAFTGLGRRLLKRL